MDYNIIIDRYYPADSRLRDIYINHSESVSKKALDIAERLDLKLDPDIIRTAAMLHDIGIFATNAPDIECRGDEPYIRHGIIGAQLLRDCGMDEKYARVAERHTGAGLTAEEIIAEHLPLPPTDFLPETLLERLICFADKFFSKSGDMKEKPIERIREGLRRHSAESLCRFDKLAEEFRVR